MFKHWFCFLAGQTTFEEGELFVQQCLEIEVFSFFLESHKTNKGGSLVLWLAYLHPDPDPWL